MTARPSRSRYRRQCAAILRWWDSNGRKDLPWQDRGDPYLALVAEVMLQQTTVATVLRYFSPFTRRFPDARSLAAADTDQVLMQWQGLGYYARARNLHKACQAVVADGGQWPDNAQAWACLPGVGRSTANAISASLSDKPHAILDGNVKRVLARLFAVDTPINDAKTIAELWGWAEALLPARRGRDFAQAMMDLGATVCKRAKPLCASCPLREDCLARQRKLVEKIPRKAKAVERSRSQYWLLFIRRSNGCYLFGPRPSSGVWGGLWTPPMPEAKVSLPELGGWLRHNLGINAKSVRLAEPIRHELTHISMTLHPVEMKPSPMPRAKRIASNVVDEHRGVTYGWHRLHQIPGGMPKPIYKLSDQLCKLATSRLSTAGIFTRTL